MAANNMNAPNVWGQMNYVPPRGQCNFRQSMLSPKCACLRFMLHPLKSSSSYECDGCAHHASFHTMENREEDQIRKRWEQEAREKTLQQQQLSEDGDLPPRKRVREIEYTRTPAQRLLETSADRGFTAGGRANASARGKGKAGGTKGVGSAAGRGARGVGTRTRGKVMEVEEDEEYIELD